MSIVSFRIKDKLLCGFNEESEIYYDRICRRNWISLILYLLPWGKLLCNYVKSIAASDYGLFLSDDDPRKGIWLESGRTLDYYMLRNGVNHII